jgi:hypothetical protein
VGCRVAADHGLMPLLDTVVLLLYLLQYMYMPCVQIRSLDIVHVRNVVKGADDGLARPAVLTSVVYAKGNNPGDGGFNSY